MLWTLLVAFSTLSSANAGLPPATLPAWTQRRWTALALDKQYTRVAYAKPGFLQADFNGDGKLDVAILVQKNQTQSRGILIFHQGQPTPYIVGTGRNTSTDILRGDFGWADRWSIYTGSTTNEVTISANGDLKDRVVRLKHPTIEIGKEEGGGMIYWNGKRYVWIHQTC